jgi:hypothetical protein
MPDGFPDPWWQPAASDRDALRDELLREVGPDHPLDGLSIDVVARCEACDEVLARTGDSYFWLVHLTWSGQRESGLWPRSQPTGGFVATEVALTAHAMEHA